MPWILILVLNLMKTGGDVELMDDFMNEEVNVVNFPYKNMENEQDMVTKEWMSRDWCPADDGLSCGHDSTMDFEMNLMRWIGTTEISAVECPLNVGQLKVGSMGGGETSTVEDWRFDFSCLEDFNTKTVQELSLDSEPVQDWGLDYTNESCEGFMQSKSTGMVTSYFLTNVKVAENFIGALVFDLERHSVILQWMMENFGWEVYMFLSLFLVLGAEMMRRSQQRSRTLVRRHHEPRGHLSKARRWSGGLRQRFECRMKTRSLIFLSLWTSGQAMDGEQAQRMFNHLLQMTEATMNAARSSAMVAEKLNKKDSHGSFSEASKVLKAPEAFEVDDPLKFVSWSDNFKNWLTYGDHRYVELLKQVEELDEPCTLAEFASDEVVELGHRLLFAILASYVKGPAAQFVKAASTDRNGFRVWQQLRNLYLPRARPRVMAIGQAIMGLPQFRAGRSMMENLLQLDLLLDQYRVASGHEMPDDLVVSTVMRCVDQNVRRHLELTVDDTVDYNTLKEKLILMDKNSRVWSGDTYLKLVQNTLDANNGPAPMEVDSVNQVGKGKYEEEKKARARKVVGSLFRMVAERPVASSRRAKVARKAMEGRKERRAKESSMVQEKAKVAITPTLVAFVDSKAIGVMNAQAEPTQ